MSQIVYSYLNLILNSFDISTIKGIRNKIIIEILCTTGVTISELLNLEINDIYFDLSALNINNRIIELNKNVIELLKLYISDYRCYKTNKDNELIYVKPDIICRNHVFLTHRGKKLTRVWIFLIIKDINNNFNKNINLNLIRNSYIKNLLNLDTIDNASKKLGHVSIFTTQRNKKRYI